MHTSLALVADTLDTGASGDRPAYDCHAVPSWKATLYAEMPPIVVNSPTAQSCVPDTCSSYTSPSAVA